MFYHYPLFGREIPDNELFGSAFQYSVCWPFGVAGLTQLFAVAVDYYHGFMGGFGDILLFYGGGEKESLKIWLAINGLNLLLRIFIDYVTIKRAV